MKKIAILLAMIVSLTIANKSYGQSLLDTTIKVLNKMCPISMGLVGSIESAQLEPQLLVLKLSMNEEYINLDAVQKNKETFAIEMAKGLNTNFVSNDFLELLLNEGCGIKYILEGTTSHDTTSITINTQILRSVSDAPKSTPLDILKTSINNTKLQLPTKVDEISMLVDIDLVGDKVTYFYEIEDISFTLDDIDIDELKTNTMDELHALRTDLINATFYRLVLNAGKQLCYHYKGTESGDTIEFTINTDELKQILSN